MSSLLRNRSDLVPVLTTLLVGGVLIAVISPVLPADPCSEDQRAVQAEQQGGSTAIHMEVLSSTNKNGVLAEMACRFEATSPVIGDRPVDVVITSEPSGNAYERIADLKPTVWSPAATSWVRMLRSLPGTLVAAADAPSIATSPQVIAMPRPIAESLGWPGNTLGWNDIVDFATGDGRWDGDRWGSFKLGKTNPRLSTSGLNSTVATFQVATGTAADLTTAVLEDEEVMAAVHAVESAAVHYAPTSVDFLTNLRAQDEQGRGEDYVSAILLEEKSVWDYNQGNPSGVPTALGEEPPPATELVAFYPEEGALVADHPYAVLTGDWVDADQREAADDFLDFLLAPEQQERFQALGFRDAAGTPGAEISQSNGLLPGAPIVMEPPGGNVLRAIRDGWPTFRKRARLLIVMDISASMGNEATPRSTASKLDLAKQAALAAIAQLTGEDEVGLWVFSPASAGGPYDEVVPIGRKGSNVAELEREIGELTAETDNGSELYATVRAAVDAMRGHIDDERINGVVLLSDGPNESSADDDLDAMLSAVAPVGSDDDVRFFTIAYGDQADTDLLTQIAQTSLGTAYDATDPDDVIRVFTQAVANF